MNDTIFFSFLIGFLSGLRSLTPPAVTGWAVYLGWLKPDRPFSLIGSVAAAVTFTVLAVAELIADKLPKTPNRTSLPGLIARIVMGALTGSCIAASGDANAMIGGFVGIAGAVAGTFAGFKARIGIVRGLRLPDVVVALLEDLIAIGGSLWVTSQVG